AQVFPRAETILIDSTVVNELDFCNVHEIEFCGIEGGAEESCSIIPRAHIPFTLVIGFSVNVEGHDLYMATGAQTKILENGFLRLNNVSLYLSPGCHLSLSGVCPKIEFVGGETPKEWWKKLLWHPMELVFTDDSDHTNLPENAICFSGNLEIRGERNSVQNLVVSVPFLKKFFDTVASSWMKPCEVQLPERLVEACETEACLTIGKFLKVTNLPRVWEESLVGDD
ncbi:hypothetical protein HOD08_04630, partial [bacterium]|nr:hypothetical protein [bacterium]